MDASSLCRPLSRLCAVYCQRPDEWTQVLHRRSLLSPCALTSKQKHNIFMEIKRTTSQIKTRNGILIPCLF
uniref:Uncharacterized protein n=1 Tax=Physcomitrium patens TaxID=3218 RepID=A0A7I4EX98_PHYPA